jgi:hypothetical protein
LQWAGKAEHTSFEVQTVSLHVRKKTMPFGSKHLEGMNDYFLFYAKSKDQIKFRTLFQKQNIEGLPNWIWVELPNGEVRKLINEEHRNHSLLPAGYKIFRAVLPRPSGYSESMDFEIEFEGKKLDRLKMAVG